MCNYLALHLTLFHNYGLQLCFFFIIITGEPNITSDIIGFLYDKRAYSSPYKIHFLSKNGHCIVAKLICTFRCKGGELKGN